MARLNLQVPADRRAWLRRLSRWWMGVGLAVVVGIGAMAVSHYIFGAPVNDANTGRASTPENTLLTITMIGAGGAMFFLAGLALNRWLALTK